MKKLNILIIDPGYLREQGIRTLFQAGFNVTILSTFDNDLSSYATHNIRVESLEYEELGEIYNNVNLFNNNIEKIDGIICYSDSHLRLLNSLCEKFNLNKPFDIDPILLLNKNKCSKTLLESGIYTAISEIVLDNTPHLLNEQGPFILKPNIGSCSLGVKKINSKEEFFKEIKVLKSESLGDIIIQTYLEGNEYSVEAAVYKGDITILGVVEKTSMYNNIEMGHMLPANNIDSEAIDRIKNCVKKAIGVFPIKNSVIHAEVKNTLKGPAIVEINYRTPGDYLSLLYSNVYGVSLDVIAASIACDIEPPKLINLNKFSGIQFFGDLCWEQLEHALYKIIDYRERVFIITKDQFKLENNGDRMFCIINVGDNSNNVYNRLKELEKKVLELSNKN